LLAWCALASDYEANDDCLPLEVGLSGLGISLLTCLGGGLLVSTGTLTWAFPAWNAAVMVATVVLTLLLHVPRTRGYWQISARIALWLGFVALVGHAVSGERLTVGIMCLPLIVGLGGLIGYGRKEWALPGYLAGSVFGGAVGWAVGFAIGWPLRVLLAVQGALLGGQLGPGRGRVSLLLLLLGPTLVTAFGMFWTRDPMALASLAARSLGLLLGAAALSRLFKSSRQV
jgi:hypothetical protein